jgi:hypothetical protein
MTTRVLMVEVRGSSKALVDRAADLLADQVKSAAAFVQASVEKFADEGRTTDDPPAETPEINVSNALIHG